MREDLEQRLRRHLPNLDAAAIPTKCEVFTICGSEARDLHDAIEEATALISAARKGQGEWRDALVRADALIKEMSNYIGKMALGAGQLSALNDHWLFMQRNRSALPPPPEQGE